MEMNRLCDSLRAKGYHVFYAQSGQQAADYIVATLPDAIQRTRNVAAPANARRLHLDTPCAKGEAKCYDCHSPHRICNAMVIHLNKMDDMDMEVVLVDEDLGL